VSNVVFSLSSLVVAVDIGSTRMYVSDDTLQDIAVDVGEICFWRELSGSALSMCWRGWNGIGGN